MNIRSKKGFTLMEMLIVVAIIAILVAIAIPVFSAQLDNARKAVDDANMRSAMSEAVTYAMTDDATKTAPAGVTRVTGGGWTITFAYGTNNTLSIGAAEGKYNQYKETGDARSAGAKTCYISVAVSADFVPTGSWIAAK